MAKKELEFLRESDTTVRVKLGGDWHIQDGLQDPGPDVRHLQSPPGLRTLVFDGHDLGQWDSALVAYLLALSTEAQHHQLDTTYRSMPEGAVRLLALARAIPAREGMTTNGRRPDLAERLGTHVISTSERLLTFVTFFGESLLSFKRFVLGQSVYRRRDLFNLLHNCGPSSLGIITLISVLIGMILAFVGAVQLEKFGASIFVASLVGLAMAREMAAMMTAIIMAGRTGAAFAAQLGSMQVNEEVDALKTMGVDPIDFLVLPRMLALILMVPLLTAYANLMGILGGALVSTTMLDLTSSMYFEQMINTVPLVHFLIGLFKSIIFAVLIALSGCYMGINSGRSATAVGQATTAAVVVGIVLIIVFDSLVTIVTTIVGI